MAAERKRVCGRGCRGLARASGKAFCPLFLASFFRHPWSLRLRVTWVLTEAIERQMRARMHAFSCPTEPLSTCSVLLVEEQRGFFPIPASFCRRA